MKTNHKLILWIVGLVCLVLIYFLFDPTHSHLAPKCPFWLMTGYYCPGCGSQRAIHAFLHGHFWEGIQYNYLLLPSLAYIILLTVAPKDGKLIQKLTSSTACWILFSVFMAWWLVRNLSGI